MLFETECVMFDVHFFDEFGSKLNRCIVTHLNLIISVVLFAACDSRLILTFFLG